MGLVPGFVLQVNRRALLAVLAVGISVSYALVAGAAVGGLNEAQTALAGDLSDTVLVASEPGGGTFELEEIQPDPDTALVRTQAANATVYTVRHGNWSLNNASRALAPPESTWQAGENVTIADENRTIVHGDPPRGASRSWLGVTDAVFVGAGGPQQGVHLAIYEETSDELASSLEEQGYDVNEAPATFPFYTKGSLQLVSAVSVTVVASALVVALLTSSVVSLELSAKRSSFATLQVYAGSGLVRRLVAGRGVTILAAGHLLGAAVTFGSLFLLERAGAAQLALPGGYTATALAATFGGGLLGLVFPIRRAGQPLTATELGAAEQPLDLPRPLRLTLASWKTLVPLAISAMILAGSLGVIFGAVDMPSQLFGTDDANVIAETNNNPLRGTAPAFLGRHLGGVDGFAASSPEIYAPTTIRGQPVMVRGVVWENLAQMDPVQLQRGKAPENPGEAVLGMRLAGKLDASLGETYVVPAAYSAHVERVTVVGFASAPGLLGDEMLVALDTARSLTGVPADQVNIVRYRTDPGFTPNASVREIVPSGIEATDLTVQPERPIPLSTATARVDLVNFATSESRRQLTLRVNGAPTADRFVTLDGHETGTADIQFRVPETGLLNLQVNPSRDVQTGEPAYEIGLPDTVLNETSFNATVTRASDGEPAQDVMVQLGDAADRTNSQGRAQLTAVGIGNRTVTADGPAGQGADTIVVVEPGDLHRPRLIYREINGPDRVDSGQAWPATAIVENVGGEAFDGLAQIPVDNRSMNASEAHLLSGERGRIEFELDLSDGRHRIGQGDAAITITVGSPDAGDDTGAGNDTGQDGDTSDGNQTDGTGDGDQGDGGGDDGTGMDGDSTGGDTDDGATGEGEGGIRELLQQRAASGRSSQTPQPELDATQAFLADTFENFNAAVTVVTIATVLHAGLIGLVAVRRDVEENANNLATMATVGAERRLLRRRALAEFGVVGAIASLVGVGLGLGLVAFAAEQAWIGGFGHALVPRTGLGFALRVVAVSLLVTLASVIVAVEQVRGRSIGALLTQGPERSQRPPLAKLIGGPQ